MCDTTQSHAHKDTLFVSQVPLPTVKSHSTSIISEQSALLIHLLTTLALNMNTLAATESNYNFSLTHFTVALSLTSDTSEHSLVGMEYGRCSTKVHKSNKVQVVKQVSD